VVPLMYGRYALQSRFRRSADFLQGVAVGLENEPNM
jgi:hypothetical protein